MSTVTNAAKANVGSDPDELTNKRSSYKRKISTLRNQLVKVFHVDGLHRNRNEIQRIYGEMNNAYDDFRRYMQEFVDTLHLQPALQRQVEDSNAEYHGKVFVENQDIVMKVQDYLTFTSKGGHTPTGSLSVEPIGIPLPPAINAVDEHQPAALLMDPLTTTNPPAAASGGTATPQLSGTNEDGGAAARRRGDDEDRVRKNVSFNYFEGMLRSLAGAMRDKIQARGSRSGIKRRLDKAKRLSQRMEDLGEEIFQLSPELKESPVHHRVLLAGNTIEDLEDEITEYFKEREDDPPSTTYSVATSADTTARDRAADQALEDRRAFAQDKAARDAACQRQIKDDAIVAKRLQEDSDRAAADKSKADAARRRHTEEVEVRRRQEQADARAEDNSMGARFADMMDQQARARAAKHAQEEALLGAHHTQEAAKMAARQRSNSLNLDTRRKDDEVMAKHKRELELLAQRHAQELGLTGPPVVSFALPEAHPNRSAANRGAEKARDYVEGHRDFFQPAYTDEEEYDPDWALKLDRKPHATPDPRYRPVIRAELAKFNGDLLAWDQWKSLFHGLVHRTPTTYAEKLSVLHMHLEGRPKKLVAHLTRGFADYQAAWQLLERWYGDASEQRRSYKAELQKVKSVPENNSKAIQDFASTVTGLLSALRDDDGLDIASTLSDLSDKLPYTHRTEWRRLSRQQRGHLQLRDFTDWLGDLATDTRDFATGPAFKSEVKNAPAAKGDLRSGDGGKRAKGSANAAGATQADPQRKDYCPFCQKDGHRIVNCKTLQSKPAADRYQLVHDLRPVVCCKCMTPGHIGRDKECPRVDKECGIDGCKRQHHPKLHGGVFKPRSTTASAVSRRPPTFTGGNAQNRGALSPQEEDEEDGCKATSNAATCNSLTTGARVSFGVLQAWVTVGHRRTLAKVVLDSYSDTSFISADFRKRAGLKRGRRINGEVGGILGVQSALTTHEVRLKLEPVRDGEAVELTAWEIPTITNEFEEIDWEREKTRFPHLQDLDIFSVTAEAPDILLALDCSEAHVPRDAARVGKPNEPYGIKTALGWTVLGRIDSEEAKKRTLKCTARTAHATTNFKLPELAERFFDGEDFGTEYKREYTKEEASVWADIQEGIVKLDGPGYQVKLPWKASMGRPGNNLAVAEARLRSTMSSLSKAPQKSADYGVALAEYLEEGYAVETYNYDPRNKSGQSKEEDQYFLPHHGVYKKAGGKIRIVFDAAATAVKGGPSLNDHLHVGPKLQVEIPAVLTRWREEAVSYGADVKGMFSRIRISEEDSRVHGWLWGYTDRAPLLTVHRHRRLVFGDGPSPCLALAVMQRTAQDYGDGYPEAQNIVCKGMYVDDLLDSVPTLEVANQRAAEVVKILANGDFELRKWNSSDVHFSMLNGEDQPADIRILGMMHCLEDDTIRHAVPDAHTGPHTKRSLLSAVASFFSPLGLASPYVVMAKVRLKALHCMGLDWDESLEQQMSTATKATTKHIGE